MKVGGLDLALGDVVAFAVTLWIAIWLSRALKFALDEVVLPSLDVRRGSAAAISTTAKYAVIGVGFGSAVLAAGVEMTRFTVLAGTLGVGIGFGLQNVVNNFVSASSCCTSSRFRWAASSSLANSAARCGASACARARTDPRERT